MTANLFNGEFSGTSEFHWWMGQIVDEKNWVKNYSHKVHKRDDEDGWGYRYKVRIFGRDTKEKYQDTEDDQLPMAEVMFPVTGGSGHTGSSQTPNLRQGNYVIGFYKDGIDGTEPIIMGTLGNQSQTRLFGGDPNEGYIPRSGYIGLDKTKTSSTKNLLLEGPSEGTPPLEESPHPFVGRVAHVDQLKDGAYSHFVPKTRECDGPNGEMKGVQRALRNVLKLVNQIRSEASSFFGAASDLQNAIPSLINTASAFIAELIKTMIDKIRGYTNNIIDDGIKDIVNFVIPNQRSRFNRVVEQQQDGLQCLFNKLIDGLLALVKGLVQRAVDELIDAPMCAAENMAGGVFGDIIGPIANKVDKVVKAIQAAAGAGFNVQGGPLDILNILWGLLGFLSCDEKLDCTMNDQWSFWYGAKEKSDEVRANLASLAQSFSGGGGGGGGCDTQAKPCTSPRVNFTGDTGPNGTPAQGNPVIGPDGSLLAVDVVDGGSGYTNPPTATAADDCGKGNGATMAALVAPTGQTTRGPQAPAQQEFAENPERPTPSPGDVSGLGDQREPTGLGGLPGFADAQPTTPTPTTGTGASPTTGTGTSPGGTETPQAELPKGNGTFVGQVTFDENGNFEGSGTFLSDDGRFTGGGKITGSGSGEGTQPFKGTGNYDNQSFSGTGTATDSTGATVGQGTFTGNSIIGAQNNLTTVDSESTEEFSVTGVLVLDPGISYLPGPDGDVGANGDVYAKSTDTIVGNATDGYKVLPPFATITVLPGDTVAAPPNTQIEIYDQDGEITQVIVGQGPLVQIPVETGGSFTTPDYTPPTIPQPTSPTSNGSYPVVLELGEVVVTNSGVNYAPGDTITITPDRGAVLEPVFDSVGALAYVNVIERGIGFVEWPEITIQSRQGVNAKMVPLFNIIRIGDLAEEDDTLPPDVQLISVVDCVGKVTTDSRGNTIPNN